MIRRAGNVGRNNMLARRSEIFMKCKLFKDLALVGMLGVIVTFSACAKTVKKADWHFQKEAIQFHIKADHKLNLYNGREHTLYVCFYQLHEAKALERTAQDTRGLYTLLECKLFDESVVSADSDVIHAGENISLTFDRAEGAKYVAVVAGYSGTLNDDRVLRVFKVPTYEKCESYFNSEYRCVPCSMEIQLDLGPNQIEHGEILKNELNCNDECEKQN
jgi:type VI secretion system VasD/TssJ family lipoprotein